MPSYKTHTLSLHNWETSRKVPNAMINLIESDYVGEARKWVAEVRPTWNGLQRKRESFTMETIYNAYRALRSQRPVSAWLFRVSWPTLSMNEYWLLVLKFNYLQWISRFHTELTQQRDAGEGFGIFFCWSANLSGKFCDEISSKNKSFINISKYFQRG